MIRYEFVLAAYVLVLLEISFLESALVANKKLKNSNLPVKNYFGQHHSQNFFLSSIDLLDSKHEDEIIDFLLLQYLHFDFQEYLEVFEHLRLS